MIVFLHGLPHEKSMHIHRRCRNDNLGTIAITPISFRLAKGVMRKSRKGRESAYQASKSLSAIVRLIARLL